MKVGIDVRELEKGKATGIGQYLYDLLKLSPLYRREWTFTLFGNQNTHIDLEAVNIRKILIPEYLTFWWDQAQLPYHLAKEKVDVFLTPYFKAPVIRPCKLVVIINDLIPLLLPEYRTLNRLCTRIYFKALTKASTLNADKIITISDHSKKDILRNFNVSENKIETVYLGVNSKYRPSANNIKHVGKKYNITKNYILYFGNFNPHKNVETLLKAYRRLPGHLKSKYQLVLGGRTDSHCRELERWIKKLSIDSNVIFTDFILEEDLPAIYGGASLFVFPSLYEGFGLPPLEAMACGTPVITSNKTSLPEVMGDAGILVDPCNVEDFSNSIKKVLLNQDLKNEMRQKGLSRAKMFSPQKTAGDILNILEQAVFQNK